MILYPDDVHPEGTQASELQAIVFPWSNEAQTKLLP